MKVIKESIGVLVNTTAHECYSVLCLSTPISQKVSLD
jgi:hypothetical protein